MMHIPVNEFELHIAEPILKRGLQYFKKGLVEQVEEFSPGEYEAIVQGTDIYTVRLKLHNGILTGAECTCPYVDGHICKHGVAALFYLQQDVLQLSPAKKNKKKAESSPAKKKSLTIKEKLNALLDTVSHDELKAFVGELCDSDRNVRNQFLTRYLSLIEPSVKKTFSSQIKAIVRANKGRHGFIDYRGASRIGREMLQLYQLGVKAFNSNNHREAMHIACALIEELTLVLYHADDSNADFSDIIRLSVDQLFSIEEHCTDKDVRDELFQYCVNAYLKETFKDWDWHQTMITLASELAESPSQLNTLEKIVGKVPVRGSDSGYDYDYENQMYIHRNLIEKTKGHDAMLQFMKDNLSVSLFRSEMIQYAYDAKDYAKALSLCDDGIREDEQLSGAKSAQWKKWKLTIYIEKGDGARVLEIARSFFVDAFRTEDPKQLVDLMKANVAPSEWDDFFEKLVSDKIKARNWSPFYSIADMYIWDNRTVQLFEWVKKDVSIEHLNYVVNYLLPGYREEMIEMYIKAIENFVDLNVGRNFYVTAAKLIRTVIKWGGKDKANELVALLRDKYKQRKALIEELKNFALE